MSELKREWNMIQNSRRKDPSLNFTYKFILGLLAIGVIAVVFMLPFIL